MAATAMAPNLRRFDVPESSSFPWTGVMRDLDDLVERVMSAHMKRSEIQELDSPAAQEDDLVRLLSVHSVYDSPQHNEAAA